VLHLEGDAAWSVRTERYRSRPGMVGVKVPGEVYTEYSPRGLARFQVLLFDDALIHETRAALDRPPPTPRAGSFDGLRDARVQPLVALHRVIADEAASDAELEQSLAEALVALVALSGLAGLRAERHGAWSNAVARARALLDADITGLVTLDELATHAGLDKFHLCRAFREQVGLPPHAYITHRRVSLAQVLLAQGVPQAEVALRVGLYDQSQLHRHFKRILGVTPGAYARAACVSR
jgi:AraC-like DNA-binding protein